MGAHRRDGDAERRRDLGIGPAGAEELDARLRAAMAAGMSLRDAAASVAEATGLKRRDVYRRALEIGDASPR